MYGRPAVEFSPWVKWSIRNSIGPVLDEPGIYLLANYDAAIPLGPANPQDPRIVYIGETHDQTLRIRFGAFQRSAFQGKDGHAGGETYRVKFPDDNGDKLHVSVFPPKIVISRLLHPTYIMYIENALRWEFAVSNKRLPACNKE